MTAELLWLMMPCSEFRALLQTNTLVTSSGFGNASRLWFLRVGLKDPRLLGSSWSGAWTKHERHEFPAKFGLSCRRNTFASLICFAVPATTLRDLVVELVLRPLPLERSRRRILDDAPWLPSRDPHRVGVWFGLGLVG